MRWRFTAYLVTQFDIGRLLTVFTLRFVPCELPPHLTELMCVFASRLMQSPCNRSASTRSLSRFNAGTKILTEIGILVLRSSVKIIASCRSFLVACDKRSPSRRMKIRGTSLRACSRILSQSSNEAASLRCESVRGWVVFPWPPKPLNEGVICNACNTSMRRISEQVRSKSQWLVNRNAQITGRSWLRSSCAMSVIKSFRTIWSWLDTASKQLLACCAHACSSASCGKTTEDQFKRRRRIDWQYSRLSPEDGRCCQNGMDKSWLTWIWLMVCACWERSSRSSVQKAVQGQNEQSNYSLLVEPLLIIAKGSYLTIVRSSQRPSSRSKPRYPLARSSYQSPARSSPPQAPDAHPSAPPWPPSSPDP